MQKINENFNISLKDIVLLMVIKGIETSTYELTYPNYDNFNPSGDGCMRNYPSKFKIKVEVERIIEEENKK